MNEGEDQRHADEERPTWKRVGKILFVVGLILIVSNGILAILAGFAEAYSESMILVSVYNQYAYPTTIVGVFLLILGILTYLWADGLHREFVWSMKTGPYYK
ncbi:hypothetical protein EU537_00050 [Candidatus Thorarchaeota archaeon]|nr:MAG: hypothetical protein EU537_00050 [Candidatus Thorarchaeota archaeon]